MNYEEIKDLFSTLSYDFSLPIESRTIEEIVNFIVSVETALWRARMKIIRENPELE